MDLRKCLAETIGTFWLTFAGCGSAVVAAAFPQVGIGLLGVSLAFGLTVLTMAYAIGHISGCHLNPAVTVGLAAGGRFPVRDVVPYVAAQIVGAVIAAVRGCPCVSDSRLSEVRDGMTGEEVIAIMGQAPRQMKRRADGTPEYMTWLGIRIDQALIVEFDTAGKVETTYDWP